MFLMDNGMKKKFKGDFKLKEEKTFTVFCQFSAIGKKTVKAESLKEANQIAEADSSINFDEIIRLTEPCKVDKILLSDDDETFQHFDNVEYKSWGSE
jgi:hypothetical protein